MSLTNTAGSAVSTLFTKNPSNSEGEEKMLNTKLRRTSLILLAVVLMLSVFSMTAFAEEIVTEGEVLAAPAETDVAAIEGTEEAAEETVGETAPAEDIADETVTDEEKSEDATDDSAEEDVTTTGDAEAEEENSGLGTSDIVSLIILGIVVIVTAVYCIVKREKVGKFFRSLKSEFKKIVWSPRDQVRKNTIVVVVVVVALAVVIALADLIFMK